MNELAKQLAAEALERATLDSPVFRQRCSDKARMLNDLLKANNGGMIILKEYSISHRTLVVFLTECGRIPKVELRLVGMSYFRCPTEWQTVDPHVSVTFPDLIQAEYSFHDHTSEIELRCGTIEVVDPPSGFA